MMPSGVTVIPAEAIGFGVDDPPPLRLRHVRKPPGKEPAVGSVGVAVYGDLTAGRPLRAMRWSAKATVADRLQRSERRRRGFREGDLGEAGGTARVFCGDAAMGLRPGAASSGR